MSTQLSGGCFCGSIRYTFESGDYLTANCHCTMCRRTSAAAFVSWIVVPNDRFSYTKGTPKLLKSSAHGSRYFCPDCGTPVACILESHPDVIDITLCSLDAAETISPQHDIYSDTRMPWLTTDK